MIGSFEFSDIVDESVERSGGQEATASDVTKVRRGLRLLTERWLAQGYNTWRIRQQTFVASGLSTHIQLPDNVDDVIQVNSTRHGSTEKAMLRISPIVYAQLASKQTLGNPSQYYLDRKERPTLYIFPIGDPNFADHINVWYVERPEDFDRYGDTTDDVPGRWLEALVSGLALDLARKRPPYNEALIQRLKMEAAEAEDLAQRADRGGSGTDTGTVMAGRRGNPGCYPRHLGKPTGKGYKECEASGFLRKAGKQTMDVRQGLVAREFADITKGFGTNHPQDRVQLGVMDDPSPIPNARPQDSNDYSVQDLMMSDQEIKLSIQEGRPPRSGY